MGAFAASPLKEAGRKVEVEVEAECFVSFSSRLH